MYSKDFRKATLEYWAKGQTKAELYEAFGIYPSRMTTWKKLLNETESLEPQYPETRKRRIDIGDRKVTLKKKFRYSERCTIEVINYIINMIIVKIILKIMNVYVDESGFNREYRRKYARAKMSVKVYGTKPGKRDKNMMKVRPFLLLT